MSRSQFAPPLERTVRPREVPPLPVTREARNQMPQRRQELAAVADSVAVLEQEIEVVGQLSVELEVAGRRHLPQRQPAVESVEALPVVVRRRRLYCCAYLEPL